MKRLAALIVLAFALAGCGSDESNDAQPASTAPTSTVPGSPPPMATTADCELEGSTMAPEVSSSSQEPDSTMYLTNVSLSSAKCANSVVFDLEPAVPPGYKVSYEPAATAKVEDASGNPVNIEGDAFLVVRLSPAMTAKIDGDQVKKTYTGPKRLPGSGAIAEVVKTGDFEGVVTWVIGLDRKRPFLAQAADGKLFVDVESS